MLAEAYHQRWEHESGNDQLKTHLRGPAKILRLKKPDTVRQEIYGYLLTHYALSALICRAATETDIDPDRIKFTCTVRIIRRRGHRPGGLFPLSTGPAPWPRSWPTSLRDATSTRDAATAATRG